MIRFKNVFKNLLLIIIHFENYTKQYFRFRLNKEEINFQVN